MALPGASREAVGGGEEEGARGGGREEGGRGGEEEGGRAVEGAGGGGEGRRQEARGSIRYHPTLSLQDVLYWPTLCDAITL
eukprot:2995516-Rhodomonas_salina.2